jgi:hypothetical protein
VGLVITVELSRLLADERVDRLREDAQAPPGPLATLVRRLLGRERTAVVPVAWVARSAEARDLERITA